MLQVTRPNQRDISQSNVNDIVYIKGNETTDGSNRLRFNSIGDIAVIERRASGVWNDTGFRISSSSLEIGLDFTLSAAAGYIETLNTSASFNHQRSVIPHTNFTLVNGTTAPHTPILSKLKSEAIFGTAVSEVTAMSATVDFPISGARVIDSLIHQVGATGATQPVTVSYYKGTDNTGQLLFQKNLPPSDLVANQPLAINFNQDVGLEDNEDVYAEYLSAAMFSLKTDSGGNVLTTRVSHELSELGMLTENLMLDEDLNLMFDESLNPIYSVQFP